MPYKMTYNPELRILEVTVQGKYVLTEAKQLQLEAAEIIQAHDCNLILADVTNAQLGLSVSEIYYAPDMFEKVFAASTASGRRIKRAVVVGKEMLDAQFLENVAVNRGHYLKIFYEIDEAREWLLR